MPKLNNNAHANPHQEMLAALDPRGPMVHLAILAVQAPMADQAIRDHAAHLDQLERLETQVVLGPLAMPAESLVQDRATQVLLALLAALAVRVLLDNQAALAKMAVPVQLVHQAMLVLLAVLAKQVALALPAILARTVHLAAASIAHQLVWLQVTKCDHRQYKRRTGQFHFIYHYSSNTFNSILCRNAVSAVLVLLFGTLTSQ